MCTLIVMIEAICVHASCIHAHVSEGYVNARNSCACGVGFSLRPIATGHPPAFSDRAPPPRLLSLHALHAQSKRRRLHSSRHCSLLPSRTALPRRSRILPRARQLLRIGHTRKGVVSWAAQPAAP